MTATCALPLPRRPHHSVPGMRLLPVAPNEPPYDDEIEPAAAGGRPAHARIRPARRAGGATDRSGRPAPAPGGSGHRRGSGGGGGGRSAPPPAGRAPDHPDTDHPGIDRPDTAVPDAAVDGSIGPHGAEERAGGGSAGVDRSPRQLTVPEQVFTEAGPAQGPPSSDLPATGRRAARSPAAGRPAAPAREAAVIVVRAIVEALGGVRPVAHLAGWTTPRLQHDLERIAAQLGDRRRRGQVRSVRVSEPRPGVAEVSAVISRGARAAALALRMEAAGGRWRVTTLQVG